MRDCDHLFPPGRAEYFQKTREEDPSRIRLLGDTDRVCRPEFLHFIGKQSPDLFKGGQK